MYSRSVKPLKTSVRSVGAIRQSHLPGAKDRRQLERLRRFVPPESSPRTPPAIATQLTPMQERQVQRLRSFVPPRRYGFPVAERSPRPCPRRSRPSVMLHLLVHHGWVYWTGLWVACVLSAAVAAAMLINPRFTEPTAEAIAPSPVETQQDLPPWLFGAIAVGCAGGSLVVSRWLQGNDPSRSGS
ncbi:MAG: hypothetical protein D6680_11380 [Cyanobacteria bacterium J007]|nr:MAG: hypothetical protein D6680_11380 [Cyanobacteria bacterium J007]